MANGSLSTSRLPASRLQSPGRGSGAASDATIGLMTMLSGTGRIAAIAKASRSNSSAQVREPSWCGQENYLVQNSPSSAEEGRLRHQEEAQPPWFAQAGWCWQR